MRKLYTAIAVCALAGSLAAAPGAIAKKGPKDVISTLTLVATPTTIEATTTSVALSGNVAANSSCRKNRTVSFSYTPEGGTATPVGTPVVTGPNGDFSATLTPPPSTTGTLTATVAAAQRLTKGQSKGKGKKKGHKKKAKKFNCLSATAQTALTVN